MSNAHPRRISIPITVGALTVPLTIAMLVGWVLVLLRNAELSREMASSTWLLVLGIISLSVILLSQILLTLFLVKAILDGNRQLSFIDSVTHELKSPLSSIRLCLQTLDREGVSSTQRVELRQMMVTDVDRLTTFIDDVLAANRSGRRHGIRSLSQVRLVELVAQVTTRVVDRHGVPARSIHIAIPQDLEIPTDPIALETIISNLVDNAVKYATAPAEVWITATRIERGRVRIEVQDNGIGLSDRDRRLIFQRFHRVDREEVRARTGTGLGLFVVASLVKDLGGKVRAISSGEGLGTTMRVILPPREPQRHGHKRGWWHL